MSICFYELKQLTLTQQCINTVHAIVRDVTFVGFISYTRYEIHIFERQFNYLQWYDDYYYTLALCCIYSNSMAAYSTI